MSDNKNFFYSIELLCKEYKLEKMRDLFLALRLYEYYINIHKKHIAVRKLMNFDETQHIDKSINIIAVALYHTTTNE